jgi:hypothetical protein
LAVAAGCASTASSTTSGGSGTTSASSGPSSSNAQSGSTSAGSSSNGSVASGSTGVASTGSGSSTSGGTAPAGDGGIGGAAAAVHDDFESGALASMWSLTDQNGVPNTQYTPVTTVTVDTAQAHSGTHSVKVATGGGFFGVTPPAAEFYGRAWVYLAASPGNGHWAFIEGVSAGGQNMATQVRIGGNIGTYDINIQPATGGEDEVRAGGNGAMEPPPVAQWACFEFHYAQDTVEFWQDGTSVLAVTPTTTWLNGLKAPWSPQYATIRFGFAVFGATATNVWFDDIAVDAQRVGCD